MQIKPKDTKGWTYAMNYIIKNYDKALQMGNRGRNIVEKDFTINRFNKNLLDFLRPVSIKFEKAG